MNEAASTLEETAAKSNEALREILEVLTRTESSMIERMEDTEVEAADLKALAEVSYARGLLQHRLNKD